MRQVSSAARGLLAPLPNWKPSGSGLDFFEQQIHGRNSNTLCTYILNLSETMEHPGPQLETELTAAAAAPAAQILASICRLDLE